MLLYSHARDGVGLCHKNPELRLCAVVHYNLKPMERSRAAFTQEKLRSRSTSPSSSEASKVC